MSVREFGIHEHFLENPYVEWAWHPASPSASGLVVCIDSLHRIGQGGQCSLESLIKRDPIKSLATGTRVPYCFAFVSHITAILEPLEVKIGLPHLGLSIGPQPSLG